MFDQLNAKVWRSIERYSQIGVENNLTPQEVHQALSILAYHAIEKKYYPTKESPSTIELPIQMGAIPIWEAVDFFFHESYAQKFEKSKELSEEQKVKAKLIIDWAVKADLLTQTELFVFFNQVDLEIYFCTCYLSSQPFNRELLYIMYTTNPKYAQVWSLWVEVDKTLLSKLLSIVMDTTNDVYLRAEAGYALYFTGDKNAVMVLLKIIANEEENKIIRKGLIAYSEFAPNDANTTETLISVLVNTKKDEIASCCEIALGWISKKSRKSCQKIGRKLILALDKAETVRANLRLIQAIKNSGYSEAAVKILPFLFDNNISIRAAAAECLGCLRNITAIKPLIKVLTDNASEVRYNAVCALQRLKALEATPKFIALINDSDNRVKCCVAECFYEFEDKQIVPTLIGLLQTEKDEYVLKEFIDILGLFKDRRALKPLLAIAEQANNPLQLDALRALCEIGDASAIEPLFSLLKNCTDSNLRDLFVIALSNLGDQRMFDFLIEMLKNGDGLAAEKLGELGNPKAVDYLIAALDNSSVQECATIGLGLLKDERAIDFLGKKLSDKNDYVRYFTVRALGEISGKKVLPYLEWTAKNDYTIIATHNPVTTIGLIATIYINQIKAQYDS